MRMCREAAAWDFRARAWPCSFLVIDPFCKTSRWNPKSGTVPRSALCILAQTPGSLLCQEPSQEKPHQTLLYFSGAASKCVTIPPSICCLTREGDEKGGPSHLRPFL